MLPLLTRKTRSWTCPLFSSSNETLPHHTAAPLPLPLSPGLALLAEHLARASASLCHHPEQLARQAAADARATRDALALRRRRCSSSSSPSPRAEIKRKRNNGGGLTRSGPFSGLLDFTSSRLGWFRVKMATGAGWQPPYSTSSSNTKYTPSPMASMFYDGSLTLEYTQDLHLKMSKKIAQLTKVCGREWATERVSVEWCWWCWCGDVIRTATKEVVASLLCVTPSQLCGGSSSEALSVFWSSMWWHFYAEPAWKEFHCTLQAGSNYTDNLACVTTCVFFSAFTTSSAGGKLCNLWRDAGIWQSCFFVL